VSKLGPRQTLITLPDEIRWQVPGGVPPESVAEAVLAGAEEQEGSYLVLMKWFPGWMSAPHTYVTDRLCVVVSGVWWCNSGPDLDPGNAVPVYPGAWEITKWNYPGGNQLDVPNQEELWAVLAARHLNGRTPSTVDIERAAGRDGDMRCSTVRATAASRGWRRRGVA
jgi:hypothetical protein